ncbi:M23 family metallopeptidase [Agrococcus sp. DT81.2]|uniref:M23 family metallopeptidase n=1 Tax=Agrococcus sp. DT81.2 TaxID=3393414 RepID=UPI003CE45E14
MAYPVSRKLTRQSGMFGPRTPIPLGNGRWSPAFHGGVDFTPIVKGSRIPAYAVGAGTITGINLGGGAAGLNVMLRLDSDGSLWWYGHLSRVDVKRGDRVRDGQQIGLIGATGNTTGVHLHLERHWPRIDIETDPWPHIKDARDIDGNTSSWQTGNPTVAVGDSGSTGRQFLMALDSNEQEELLALARAIRASQVTSDGYTYDQAILSLVQGLYGRTGGGTVDAGALASALADIMQSLSDDDVQRIAVAVNDEAHRRSAD